MHPASLCKDESRCTQPPTAAGDFWQLPPVRSNSIFSNPFKSGVYDTVEQRSLKMFWDPDHIDSIEKNNALAGADAYEGQMVASCFACGQIRTRELGDVLLHSRLSYTKSWHLASRE